MSAALLIATLAVPAIGAILAVLAPERTGKLLGTIAAAITLGCAIALAPGNGDWSFGGDGLPAIRPWHSLDVSWVPGLDLRFHLGVDGMSYPLVVLTALLTLLCCGYTMWRTPERGRLLISLLLVIQVGILGVFLALDLVLFFVFFEVTLLPMYAVIAGWGGENRRMASRKFLLYTLFGSVLLLVGVLLVVSKAHTADLVALTGGSSLSRDTQYLAFGLLAIAFAVKSPLWPLHTWLPDAHTEAPTVGSVILAGVLLKMGTYGMLRVAVGVAPDAARRYAPVLGILAVAAIVIGGLVCFAQMEIKRLIAYSSVGHMGFVVLGIATLTATGFQAALIGNVAHGLITGLLFFLVGAIKDRTHTGDLAAYGGLRETAPGLAGLLGFAAIASLGLPGLAGFWGEAFAVFAAFDRGGLLWVTLGVLAALGAALAAAYFLRLLRIVTHGPASPLIAGLAEPSPPPDRGPQPEIAAGPTLGARIARVELAAWAPLVVLTLVVGLAPVLVIGVSADAAAALASVVTR
jgi:NADH-quinone oxidoreductase subunit M